MKASKTKTTVFAIIALIIVCGGSFIGVKLMNSSNTVQAVVTTIASTLAPTAAQTTSTTTTAPSTTSNIIPEISTMPIATTKVAMTEGSNNGEAAVDQFSTFAVSTTKETTEKASKSKAVESTTKKASDDAAETTGEATTMNANDIEISNEAEAQELIDQASTFSEGFLGYLYDSDGNFFYTSNDPWQRYMGFNQIFDAGAPFVAFYYDTMRCKFRYNNMDWMIQFWKGQYGWVFVGCEIGVYYKPTDRTVEHYDCVPDKDTLKMSLDFYRKGELVATREYARYWWCTAFIPGTLDNFSDRSELEIRARITMNDPVMLLSFCNALKENGLQLNKNFTVSGLDVFVVY